MEEEAKTVKQIYELVKKGRVTPEDVAKDKAALLKVIKELKDTLEAKIDSATTTLSTKPDTSEMEEKLNSLKTELENQLKNIELTPGEKGEPGNDGADGQDGKDGKDGDIKDLSSEEIRDSLELIKEEDEKLKISAIGHLQEELDKLRKLIKGSGVVLGGSGGSSGGGRIVRSYDITSQLNGVLKTFNLPAFWRVISVHSSSFPHSFRATTDYTTSGSTITFTSEIDAAVTLATGQTVTVIYSE